MQRTTAGRVLGCCRLTARYQTVRVDDTALREGLKAMAHKRRRFGYRRLHGLLWREGHTVNHQRRFRMYRADGGGAENSPGDCFPDDAACAAQGWPETGRRHAGANADANGPKSAVALGFCVGSTDRWPAVPDADRGRQLHARMPGAHGRHIAVRCPGGAGIGCDHRTPGKTCDDHLRSTKIRK